MTLQLKVPPIGESVVEATVGEWLKKEGDFVEKDSLLVSLESEKATFELPAPQAGILKKILKKAGETVAIGGVIGELEEGAAAAAAPAAPKAAPAAAPVAAAPVAAAPVVAAAHAAPAGNGTVLAGPAARAVAGQAGIPLETVAATGKDGRILKEDVINAVATKAAAPAVAPAAARAPGSRNERVVRMSPLRRTVAARLVQVQNEAAILTTFNEVDLSAVMAIREKYKESFLKKHGVKLGFMSFFVKASVEALKTFPAVNSEVRGDEMVFKEYFDIGVAVGGGKGLVVPVVRNADQLSLSQLEKTIGDFGKRAQENKLSLEELQGGTFTISNGGVYGSMMSTPILNPPQTGILGMHNIIQRPIGVDGQVVLRPMMYLALSYDHRAIDGREAVGFLVRIRELLEAPERFLLDV